MKLIPPLVWQSDCITAFAFIHLSLTASHLVTAPHNNRSQATPIGAPEPER